MVAGAFVQGLGILFLIYWYSKSIFQVINDYYRYEFHRRMEAESNARKLDAFKSEAYDINDMEKLMNMVMNMEKSTIEESVAPKYFDLSHTEDVNYCYRLNRKVEFFNILFTFNYNYYKMRLLKNPMCWRNENDTTHVYSNTDLYSDINYKD